MPWLITAKTNYYEKEKEYWESERGTGEFNREQTDRGLARIIKDVIENQDLLKEIALTDKSNYLRQFAVAKIRDLHFLEQLALNDRDWQVRLQAVILIHNQDVLKAVVQRPDEVQNVVYNALKRISDEDFLLNIVNTTDDSFLAEESAERLVKLTNWRKS